MEGARHNRDARSSEGKARAPQGGPSPLHDAVIKLNSGSRVRHGAPELRIKLVRDFLWAEIIGTPTVLRWNQEWNWGQKHEEKEAACPPPTSSSPQGVRTRVQGRDD